LPGRMRDGGVGTVGLTLDSRAICLFDAQTGVRLG